MAEETTSTDKRPFLKRRPVLIALVGMMLLFLAVMAGTIIWLDSRKGHEFVIAQIEGLEREDGLEIGIGAIEGSIYGKMRIVDLELRDPRGPFFRAGSTRIDWRPTAWIFNELNISSAVVEQARLERVPELVDTGTDRPLLPDFDIYIAEFQAAELELAAAVTGSAQQANIAGAIDVRAGRAMVNLDAATTGSGDKLVLNLNAEPENQKLDLNADITAPAGGVIAAFLGLQNDSSIVVAGEGDWQKWDGNFAATSGERTLAELELTARDGLFGYDGNIAATFLPAGLARTIAAPQLVVNGTATVDDGRVGLDAQLRSVAATLTANGGFNTRASSFDAMRLDMRVRNPSALSPSLRAQDLQFRALLNGCLPELRYQYLLTAPQLALGKSLMTGVRVEGAGKRDPDGWSFPLEFRSGTLVGNGELLQQLASDLNGQGVLRLEGARLFASDIGLTTRSVTAVADLEALLDSGELAIGLNARAPGFLVRGVGLADIAADISVGTGSTGLELSGDATTRMRRMDNGFLGGLAGGLPVLETGLGLGPDNRLRFSNLKIDSPDLRFQGQGIQRTAAEFSFSGRGDHSQYGSFDLELDGRLARPDIALLLDSPLPAAGLSRVRLDLEPVDSGFAFTTAGGSTLGPFEGDGRIVLVAGEQTVVRINRLLVSDTVASGNIRPTSLGLAGNLNVTGGGVEGSVMFEPGTSADAANRQLIRAQLEASNARFDGEPPILIRAGSLDADILLVEGQSDITATVRAQGISRGEVMIGRIAGNATLTNGTGQATFSIAGTRGSSFDFQAKADITPDRYVMTGNGVFEGRSLRFARPLELRRAGDGWAASPTVLRYGNGTARLSGKWGDDDSRLDLQLTRLPLSLLDIVYDDLELGGEASGSIRLTQSGSRLPVGDASLKIRNLTRSGLILTSTPVDLGLNVAVSRRNAAARGVIKSQAGKTIGRFQGRVTGLGNGRWQDELRNRPLFAQARFNGAAESLWRLTGVETFDLTGPVAMSADIGGTLASPEIEGQLRTTSARLESPLTGTVISGIKASGQFDGSRLILPAVSGQTRGGGTVSGSGSFDFAVADNDNIGITFDVNAERAALIARDDFAATVSGPIKIRSSAEGGQISGDVVLNRSFFQFGRASETVALPDIRVTEINRRADERPRRSRSRPWRFAINANAPNRLQVEGLGLSSEWRADLRVSGPVDNFALTGSANLVRGNYTFAGRRFQLQRGRIRFVGNQPPNPILDIEAEANLTGLNATINVTGTGNRPEIAFASVPALPEDELLSRILFGASISDLSAPEAVQLAAAVASLNSGGGLDPINQLRKAVGLDRLRILPSDTDTGSGTSIAAGKYITRRAYVELITDGKGYSATRLEFQITRWLSILSSISTLGRQSANIQVSRDY
ncbi:translocation and assembly module TamB [Parasphingorhabdus marina DSM 22363]|uniref:Translocation and assembly module TamB n=1 Tax=Parasphingorhabdus marina DSM 22363 TaxID=1123272 RepID=A0A1N6CT10_9SPHN|nr:translocation/assembly module TamB domain-containing protein [Parasphingorhabdus marina]SIN61534.1 translocation and assembly module TamB [Parasphingorhabdus marina DSM 22363]